MKKTPEEIRADFAKVVTRAQKSGLLKYHNPEAGIAVVEIPAEVMAIPVEKQIPIPGTTPAGE